MLERINETASYISKYFSKAPEIGIILGTGLGGLVREITVEKEIPYSELPHFPTSSVEGHAGKLIIGTLAGKPVVAMQGRIHYYEGWSMKDVTYPIRVMKFLGIKLLVLSNAAGGLNPDYKVGDIMMIRDHINLFPEHPLRGENDNSLGPRFPDMSEVYQETFRTLAQQIAKVNDIKLHEGVYAGVSGPTFETPAEYHWLRVIGGDAVGMSTVPEAIVAAHMRLNLLAFSIITDMGIVGQIEKVSHEEVQRAAMATEPILTKILKQIITAI
ncbi:MAG: purine-nucleoside phosphorylase [Bacteroidales bacterium]|nr:purine-nucleoside phosphorylase [Bacteroidales bacterium]